MKAKECMTRFTEESVTKENKDTLVNQILDVLVEMVKEITTISDMRQASSNEAIRSIVRDQRKKFDAFLKLIKKKYGMTIVQEDSFKIFMEKDFCKSDPSMFADMVKNRVF